MEADSLKSTTRTKVPLKIGQRNTTSRVTASRSKNSASTTGRSPASTLMQLAGLATLGGHPRQARRQADRRRRRRNCSRGGCVGWTAVQAIRHPRELQRRKSAIRGAGHDRPRTQEKPTPPEAYVLFRGEYDKRRDKVSADTPLAAAAARPLAAEPARVRQVAVAARAPADGPRHGQSLLAGVVRHRAGPHDRRLRRHRRIADPPRTARLAGGRVPRERLGREAVLQAAGHVGHVPAVGRRRRRRNWRRTATNRLLSRGPRFRMDAEMVRDYALAASGLLVDEDRRAEREAVPAGRRLGGGRDDRQQHPRLQARQRRGAVPPQPVHVLEARAPPASMDILNAPSREDCTVRRERTQTRRCRRW